MQYFTSSFTAPVTSEVEKLDKMITEALWNTAFSDGWLFEIGFCALEEHKDQCITLILLFILYDISYFYVT